jgi:hypothetical protein
MSIWFLECCHLAAGTHLCNLVIVEYLYVKKQTYETRFPLFWDITGSGLVVSYRRFGTTYQSHLQATNSPFLLGLHDP